MTVFVVAVAAVAAAAALFRVFIVFFSTSNRKERVRVATLFFQVCKIFDAFH